MHHWTNVLRTLGQEPLRIRMSTLGPRADKLMTLILHFDYLVASPPPKILSGSDSGSFEVLPFGVLRASYLCTSFGTPQILAVIRSAGWSQLHNHSLIFTIIGMWVARPGPETE